MTGAIKGTGMTMGLTDGTNNGGLGQGEKTQSYFYGVNSDGTYGSSVGTTNTLVTSIKANVSIGITTDSSKSGIIVERNNSKYLHFFVN